MADITRSGNQPSNTGTQQQNRGMSRRQEPPMTGLGGDLLSMSPFAIMRRLNDEMDRLFGDFPSGRSGGEGGEGSRLWAPALEVRHKGDNLEICAELPGIDPKEVNVEVNNDTLVIEGERKREQSSDEGGWHRSERSYGRFYRAIPLPEGANAEQAKAEFNNGMLQITVPVQQRTENRRRIQVQGASAQGSGSTGTSGSTTGTTTTSTTSKQP